MCSGLETGSSMQAPFVSCKKRERNREREIERVSCKRIFRSGSAREIERERNIERQGGVEKEKGRGQIEPRKDASLVTHVLGFHWVSGVTEGDTTCNSRGDPGGSPGGSSGGIPPGPSGSILTQK